MQACKQAYIYAMGGCWRREKSANCTHTYMHRRDRFFELEMRVSMDDDDDTLLMSRVDSRREVYVYMRGMCTFYTYLSCRQNFQMYIYISIYIKTVYYVI